MKSCNRRDFLKTMGVSGLVLLSSQSLFAAQAGAAVQANPLLLPGESGVLGVLKPTAPFALNAGSSSLEILQGKETALWVYKAEHNGASFINPVIKVKKGDLFSATLENGLSEPTIIHWHGLHVDAKNDGHPADAISGGGSYAYEFAVANRAGTYWYHTHAHGLTGKQAYYGLAGFYIVEDDEELALQEALDLEFGKDDIPLLLQDKRFDSSGNLVYSAGGMPMMSGMDGFLGNTVLANLTHNATMDVETRIYRFRILNGSNSRIYRLAFLQGLAQVPFSIIGTDGGLLDAPRQANEVFLAPGERVDVLLDLTGAAVGSVVRLTSLPFRGMDMMGRRGMMGMIGGRGIFGGGYANGSALQVLRLQVTEKISYDKTVPSELSTLGPPDENTNTTRDFTLSFAFMRWLINGETYSESSVPVTVNEGSREIWQFLNPQYGSTGSVPMMPGGGMGGGGTGGMMPGGMGNMMSMPHPMHLHGFSFRVTERSGSPAHIKRLAVDNQGRLPTDLGVKDTVLVWPGETVSVAVDFTHSFSGAQRYLLHCHNLEHADAGMMINYAVGEPD